MASALSWLMDKGALEDLNPVTTVGSMQVKVSFARTVFDSSLDDDEVRDKLYTRAGGILAGTARLIDYTAQYDDIIYRFADYNAGVYASRNAEFQAQLGQLVGEDLALDGDLQAYEDDGDPKDIETKSLKAMFKFSRTHDIWDWTVRRNVSEEKSADFEDTTIWESVRNAWQEKNNQTPPYARIPNVSLASPKLLKKRSTAWFANSVKRRYDVCRGISNQN